MTTGRLAPFTLPLRREGDAAIVDKNGKTVLVIDPDRDLEDGEATRIANHVFNRLSAAPAPEGGAVEDLREALIQADLKIRSLPGTDQSDVEFIREALATREEAPASLCDHGHTDPMALCSDCEADSVEAPAEGAGEDVNWKAEYEAACEARISDRQKSQEVINERDKWVAELLQERAALRAQPPAREDAQPVSRTVTEELIDIVEGIGGIQHGTWRDEKGLRLKDTPAWVAFYVAARNNTHPAPDALREANLWWDAEDWELTFNSLEDAYDEATGGEMRGVAKLGRATKHDPVWALRIDFDTTGDGDADDYEIRLFKSVDDAHAYLAALQAEQKGGA